jgi:prevent-host-death family protein
MIEGFTVNRPWGEVDQVILVDQDAMISRVEVTVQEAKTQFSQLLRRVEAGEEVVIRRGRERVAMLVRVPVAGPTREIWGDLEGSMAADFDEVPSDFDAYT